MGHRSRGASAGVGEKAGGVDPRRQEALDVLDGRGLRQLGEDVAQVGVRLQAVGLGGLDQGVEVGAALRPPAFTYTVPEDRWRVISGSDLEAVWFSSNDETAGVQGLLLERPRYRRGWVEFHDWI